MRGAFACLVIAACGGGGDDNRDTPVPATPFAGTLNGVPWTAGTASVRASTRDGEKTVRIFPDPGLGCTALGSEPYVVVTTPWTVGAARVDLESDNSIFIFMEATVHVVLDGRIEILSAPTEAGATAMLRVRAAFEDGDDDLFVEGEIAAMVCD